MNRYYDRIKEVLPGISESDLLLPVRQAEIDSIDMVCIRTILEKRVGELPDSLWNGFETVQHACDYCQQLEQDGGLLQEEAQSVVLKREQEINMPQMANGCLSEHWLFKELGDLHWALLSAGLCTPSGRLVDDTGARLYPTFVRIQVVHDPLTAFYENENLCLEGSLRRFGGSTYISNVAGRCAGKGIEATLMTAFSAREESNNTRLFKSIPAVLQNRVPEYSVTPPFLSEYRMIKKGLQDHFEMAGIPFSVHPEVICQTEYDINPYYDINGVGLLYFAAYPVISDVCETRYFNGKDVEDVPWETRYSTILRDVFFFANSNRGDRVIYHLNRYEYLDGGDIKLCSSLYRKSDGVLMARLFTVKTMRTSC